MLRVVPPLITTPIRVYDLGSPLKSRAKPCFEIKRMDPDPPCVSRRMDVSHVNCFGEGSRRARELLRGLCRSVLCVRLARGFGPTEESGGDEY